MVKADLYQNLPTSDELPCSDDTPVDNEDQNLLPNYLLFLLQLLWANRDDWYFGVDMGVYHLSGVNPRVPVVPDGFLSLGVPRRKPGNKSRKSYVMWEEAGTVPTLVLEMVSWSPGGEYDDKFAIYQNLGVLYYVIYNPEYWQRDRHQPFELYKLIEGRYQLQIGEPYWMPEAGLAIGRAQGLLGGMEREVLSWFDQSGHRYPSAEEQAQQYLLQVQQAQVEIQQAQVEIQQAQVEAQQERQARLDAIAQLHQMGLTAPQIAVALGLSLGTVEERLRYSDS
ncbi:Uma2 family endonuclease [Nodosilinea sp. LEGE 07088]|uniref:Uma2 family endonuclease n=1 Tax=Nodosilinea sp. LEGE 07088 TaxID=2777968 RepID=UPI0018802A97|nr:Uma2 family endonuclease [Nodosilinea sp. LEGE 07088]MBE9137526.1 Uma2 family endonuclease [Nodosilinea sp. LEGE 07088]